MGVDALLQAALRHGVDALTFWALTPRETVQTIEAARWREERAQKQAVTAAWLTATLSRAKRVPKLARLLGEGGTRVLRGEERDKRRREKAEMQERFDVTRINEAKRG